MRHVVCWRQKKIPEGKYDTSFLYGSLKENWKLNKSSTSTHHLMEFSTRSPINENNPARFFLSLSCSTFAISNILRLYETIGGRSLALIDIVKRCNEILDNNVVKLYWGHFSRSLSYRWFKLVPEFLLNAIHVVEIL